MPKTKEITGKQRDSLLKTLRARFEAHMHRHENLDWSLVQARVESNSAKLWSLDELEQSGGERDVVGTDKTTGEYVPTRPRPFWEWAIPRSLSRESFPMGSLTAAFEELLIKVLACSSAATGLVAFFLVLRGLRSQRAA